MFERFSDRARHVVVLAQEQARDLRASHIGTEHLLLGLLAQGDGVGAIALRSAGLSVEDVHADIRRMIACHVLNKDDAEALRAIGIDLDAVRAKVEESFGPGALERVQEHPPRGRGRHRSGQGHIPFSPRAKKTLELSLREALRLRHNYIGTEHILLGLLREGHGVAVAVIAARGVTAAQLRNLIMAEVGRAA